MRLNAECYRFLPHCQFSRAKFRGLRTRKRLTHLFISPLRKLATIESARVNN